MKLDMTLKSHLKQILTCIYFSDILRQNTLSYHPASDSQYGHRELCLNDPDTMDKFIFIFTNNAKIESTFYFLTYI